MIPSLLEPGVYRMMKELKELKELRKRAKVGGKMRKSGGKGVKDDGIGRKSPVFETLTLSSKTRS